MSTFPKLNIDIRDLSKPTKSKLQFVIEPEPPPIPKEKPKKVKYMYIIAVLIVMCMIFSFSFYKPVRALRRIIRMTCSISTGAQVCSAYGIGDYVVDVKGCSSFEFNGIPFTELVKHNSHYRIPSSSDMSLHIIDPCPTIIATIDTNSMIPYNKEYARKGSMYTKRVVWITDNCYNDFTLRIGKEVILDKTPCNMIDHVDLQNKTAFTYESTGLYGNLMVSGNGCDHPIHVYAI